MFFSLKKKKQVCLGILLAINAFMHLICLLYELPNAAFLITGTMLTRRQCYHILGLYIFAINMQVIVALGIAIDLFIALFFPVKYRTCRTTVFVMFFMVLGSIFSLTIVVWGWIVRNDEVIPFCNPPLGISIFIFVFIFNVYLYFFSVLYAAIIAHLKFRGLKALPAHEGKEKRRAIRRLKVIMLVFICSWFLAILGVNIGQAIGLSPKLMEVWQSNMVSFVLPAMLCYSQAFYVCIWRSSEYRSAFKEQMAMMFCRRTKTNCLTVSAAHSIATSTR
ncbi:unnamed protein product [Nippostrongylus brasiliensis]|uniref:G_PROTEIN_RECEP_F1_2 domain-containing protein n=1 Tax=Nippostrongylus brasiliensis TaxID=27835 RepID=A0A0N4XGR2_NIPBR|nr:unnamed protein product [Nippostrongylus brasiliensis]